MMRNHILWFIELFQFTFHHNTFPHILTKTCYFLFFILATLMRGEKCNWFLHIDIFFKENRLSSFVHNDKRGIYHLFILCFPSLLVQGCSWVSGLSLKEWRYDTKASDPSVCGQLLTPFSEAFLLFPSIGAIPAPKPRQRLDFLLFGLFTLKTQSVRKKFSLDHHCSTAFSCIFFSVQWKNRNNSK